MLKYLNGMHVACNKHFVKARNALGIGIRDPTGRRWSAI
jgi:hypothetical protein